MTKSAIAVGSGSTSDSELARRPRSFVTPIAAAVELELVGQGSTTTRSRGRLNARTTFSMRCTGQSSSSGTCTGPQAHTVAGVGLIVGEGERFAGRAGLTLLTLGAVG